ncbi:trp-like ion channel pkd2 [Gigaspora margarita]|uniref:Trp-like ion channel pkd2 n=1 Tax=Gigaspora margarita TaxID=4874 RepID=A0A8H4AZX8_GIGMA|nr:trp-like ion channel pkd2 [Gigaspora margarita]
MNGLFIIIIICILIIRLDASISPGHLHRRQANNTINPVSTAVGNACPTAPVVVTATVNSSTSTTVTSVSTITGSTTSFVTFTAAQAIPSAITTTLPPIDFSKELIPRNDTIPVEALKAASDFKSITSKHGFSNCGGIMDIKDFRILYSASQKTFIPLFKGNSPIVVNNATGRLYVQVYGTSIALEFDGIPCFGARNASPCTSGNVIDSGNTYDQRIAKNIGSALIKYGYFSLIESLGGYAILTIQTGNNDPYLACVMTKIADDDNIADSFVTPGAATAYTATSAALGVVCLALAAGGVVTVATVGTDGSADTHPHSHHHYHSNYHDNHDLKHSNNCDHDHETYNPKHHHDHCDTHDPKHPHDNVTNDPKHPHNNDTYDPKHSHNHKHPHYHDTHDLKHSDPHNPSHTQHPHPENAPPNEKHLGGDTSIKINDHPVGNGDHPKINHEMGGGNDGHLNTHEKGEEIPQPELGDHQVAEVGPPPHVQSPSFYDLIFYTQSIIATGWLTLNLTSEYRKFASTFSWGCAQGFINLNSLVSAANNLRYNICNIFINENMNTTSIPGACVDQENGYTLPPVGSNASFIFGSNFPTNSSQSVTNPYGFESYSHIIGIPVKDLPFTSMIGFLVVTAISIVLVLLSASIASIVIKYRQNAPEALKIMRDNVHLFLFGGILRVAINLAFPLVAFTTYQLSITNDCWMLLLLASIILFFIVFMHTFSIIQLYEPTKPENLKQLENDKKFKFVYSALYTQFRPDKYWFHRASILHTILRACVIGGIQVSGEAQLGCFFLIEFFYLSLLIEHKPYADKIYGNYLNISISFSRLLVVLLLVPFVKNLSNFVPPNILKIFSLALIILQVVILALLGMIIISKLCRMLLRSYERSGCRKNRANDVDDE